jgi:hypothetical protein
LIAKKLGGLRSRKTLVGLIPRLLMETIATLPSFAARRIYCSPRESDMRERRS